jgi:molybdopterin synthase catalytic subunit
MHLNVLFFASYRELVGTPTLTVSVPAGSTVADVVHTIRNRGAEFERLPEHPAVAVNRTVVPHGHVLGEGDEIAFLPPVAGG